MKVSIEVITNFITTERERFATRQNNMFAFAFSKISTHGRYLEIILGRYEEASAAFRTNTQQLFERRREGTHQVTDDE